MRSASWSEFPIKGVVGVLAEKEAADLDRLEKAGPLRPDAIEIRADLFEDPARAVQLFDIVPEEIPIVFTDRRAGVSKMSRHIVWEAAGLVWRLRFLSLFGRVE